MKNQTGQCMKCDDEFSLPDGLLLNRKTKFKIKVVELCPSCCRDCLIGLHNRGLRRAKPGVPFSYLLSFARHWQS